MATSSTITRADVIRTIDEQRAGAPVISGPGTLSGMLYARGYAPEILYNMELAYATAIAHGVALAMPDEKVISIEGDGSLIAGMPVFATINCYRPANLVVVCVDDGLYASFADPEQFTATAVGTDLAAVARACGLHRVHEIHTSAEFEARFTEAMNAPGPWVLVCKIPATDTDITKQRPDHDVVEVTQNVRRALADRRARTGE